MCRDLGTSPDCILLCDLERVPSPFLVSVFSSVQIKRVPNLFYVFNLKATFFFFSRGMDRDSPSCTHMDPEETCQGVRSRAADPDLPVSLAPPLGPDSQHWGRKTAHFMSSGHRSPSTSHAPRQDCVWGQAMNLFFNRRDFCWPFYQLDKAA